MKLLVVVVIVSAALYTGYALERTCYNFEITRPVATDTLKELFGVSCTNERLFLGDRK